MYIVQFFSKPNFIKLQKNLKLYVIFKNFQKNFYHINKMMFILHLLRNSKSVLLFYIIQIEQSIYGDGSKYGGNWNS